MHSTEWPEDEPLRTEVELQDNPYPSNLETMCVGSYSIDPRSGEFVWVPVLRPATRRLPCTVLERHDSVRDGVMPTYRVEMLLGNDEATDSDHTIIVDQVPHEWVFLTDQVKSADWHMPNTFRHTIMIPDEIFPDVWKNKVTGEGLEPSKKPPVKSIMKQSSSTTSGSAPAGARAAASRHGGMDEL
jgi:hypothetical protein